MSDTYIGEWSGESDFDENDLKFISGLESQEDTLPTEVCCVLVRWICAKYNHLHRLLIRNPPLLFWPVKIDF
jgi:hypothetical protein